MEHPIASKRLQGDRKAGRKDPRVSQSDVTRPMPSKIVLPVVLDELKAAGISMDDVTVVFALGSHRKKTEEEMRYLAGDAVYDEVKWVSTPIKGFCSMGRYVARGLPSIFLRRWHRRTEESALEYRSSIILRVIPAARRRSCRRIHGRQSVKPFADGGESSSRKVAGNPVRKHR